MYRMVATWLLQIIQEGSEVGAIQVWLILLQGGRKGDDEAVAC